MDNTEVVNTTSKYIVKTTGTGSETNQDWLTLKNLQKEQMVQK